MDPASGSRPLPRLGVIATALIVAGALLRFFLIADKNIWLDEAASWNTGLTQGPEFMRLLREDVHPPLYYLLIKGWMALWGDSPAALRSLSALAGAAAVWLTYLLARRLVPPVVAIAVVAWLAISPHQIYYAQEARMYSLMTTAIVGGSLAYLLWIESNGRNRRALAGLVLSATAAIYLHYFSALWLIALSLHFVTLKTRPGLRTWVGAHLLIALLYLPWMWTAIAHVRRGQPWRAEVAVSEIQRYSLDLVRQTLFGYYGSQSFISVTGIVIVGVVIAGLVALIRRALRPGRSAADTFLIVVSLAPAAGGIAALLFAGHMHLSRYICYVTPLLFVAVARGWTAVTPPARAVVALACGVAATVPSLVSYYRDSTRDSDVRPIVRMLESAPPASDRSILVAPDFMTIVARYYSRTLPMTGVGSEAALRTALDRAGGDGPQKLWLVLDYRWPNARTVAREPILEPVAVPGPQTDIWLFRTR